MMAPFFTRPAISASAPVNDRSKPILITLSAAQLDVPALAKAAVRAVTGNQPGGCATCYHSNNSLRCSSQTAAAVVVRFPHRGFPGEI